MARSYRTTGLQRSLAAVPVVQDPDKAAAFEQRREDVARFLAEAVEACHAARLSLPTPQQAARSVAHGITVEEFVASLKSAAVNATVRGGRRSRR